MKFRVLTLFPEMFDSFLATSIIGRAVENRWIEVMVQDIRAFSVDKHKRVDDAPFGGGAGMVMCVQPLKDALMSIPQTHNRRVVYLSPKGKCLDHLKVVELSSVSELVLVCGHYEGVDQRFIDSYVDEEISIGDYVLTGGELAAMVVLDSVSRMVGNVLHNEDSAADESFAQGLLEYPHYTRPATYDGVTVPEVLTSGHHAEIKKWRLLEALKITKERRPELYDAFLNADHDAETKRIIKKYL